MKAVLMIMIKFYLIHSSYERLMLKTTESSKARLENDIEIYKEKENHFEDYFKYLNRKARLAKESVKDLSKNTTKTTVAVTKTVLVKKPIPKFNEESDEDYQLKMRMPSKTADTVEHEDEDFNVDDYDFDVNHDEFAGRGKPLEPRTKIKLNKQPTRHVESKSISKPAPVVPESEFSFKAKKVPRKVADKMKEDEYDEEFLDKKTTEANKRSSNLDDDSDENDESSEYKGSSVTRTIRSPWSISNYVNKLGEKTSDLMTKVLSILPIFPQQLLRKLDEEMIIKKNTAVKPYNLISTA